MDAPTIQLHPSWLNHLKDEFQKDYMILIKKKLLELKKNNIPFYPPGKFLFNAFKFGAPPHGGSAPGIDRMIMLLSEEENLREVVAFPMNQQAEDLMLQSPSEIAEEHLRLLGIKLKRDKAT